MIMKTFKLLVPLGLMLLVIVSALSAGNIAYTYDPAGRLITTDYGMNRTISYAYDNAGNLLLSSQPSPGLIINPLDNTQFILFWPAQPAGFVLERSPTLGAGAVWTSAGATPTLNGNLLEATIPIAGSVQFYRLRQP